MPLKISPETFHVVDSNDLNQFYEDPSDTASPLVSRPGLDGYDREKLTEWLAGNSNDPAPQILLSDLACRGLVEPGSYLIRVSW
ncbi:hypothetical protein [Kitasatospora sp. NPDC002965]|uniref:hypothetical protein n=1 Tax=Kitasatospora sp. NPDC002965 TaxID=3154775 RepID=UPI0033BC8911